MLTVKWAKALACPVCVGSALTWRGERMEGESIREGALSCAQCGRDFPVMAGVPDLAPPGLLEGASWQLWREHLEAFHQRREQKQSEKAVHPGTGVNALALETFAHFIGITAGRVLDVGCGRGKFRRCFSPVTVDYAGLDPLVAPEVDGIPFVRGVAEALPFQDHVMDHVVVTSSLDHFHDLEAVFGQIARVLKVGGRFHLMQTVHGVGSPLDVPRALVHGVKSWWEERGSPIPYHMHRFNRETLRQVLRTRFVIESERPYAVSLLRPERIFLTMRVK